MAEDQTERVQFPAGSVIGPNPQVISPTKVQVSRSMLAQVAGGVSTLISQYAIAKALGTIRDALQKVPTDITSGKPITLTPALIPVNIDVDAALANGEDGTASQVSSGGVAQMKVFLDGILEELAALQDQETAIADARTLAAEPGNESLGGAVDEAEAVTEDLKAAVAASVSSLEAISTSITAIGDTSVPGPPSLTGDIASDIAAIESYRASL
jgi:hypothetical protein